MNKLCPKCKISKDISEFYMTKSRPSGSCYCKSCFNQICMQRWINRKIKAITYKGNKCFDCNNQYLYPIYEFHHLDPTQKDYDWSKLRLRSWADVIIELDKCVLLCANCHRLRHHNIVGIPGLEPEIRN